MLCKIERLRSWLWCGVYAPAIAALLALTAAADAHPGHDHAPIARDAHTIFAEAALAAETASAEVAVAYKVDHDEAIAIELRDGRKLTGKVSEYDFDGFLLHVEGEAQRIAWRELTAINTLVLFNHYMKSGSAEENFRLGRILASLDDGEELSQRIFRNAVRLDASYAAKVEALRESGLELPSLPAARVETAAPLTRPDGALNATDFTWQPLNEEELAAFVAKEKEFVAAVTEYLGVEMRLIETEHYLFYTNADQREVAKMSVLLENMYRRMSEMLNVPPQVNLWKGKALVFMCADEKLYHRIEAEIFGNPNTRDTVGICHAFNTGEVRICFQMMEDPWNLRHLLVHETTHGFLHRYRTARLIPNWLNEGLAEYMGTRLVFQSEFNKFRRIEGQRELARRGSFEGALDAQNIPIWFYGVSLSLVEMLMQKDKQAVFAMLDDIKAGTPWEESLKKHFDMSPQDMADALQRHLKMDKPIKVN